MVGEEKVTNPAVPQVPPVVIEGVEEKFKITPTVLKATAGGKNVAYEISPDIKYYFNNPEPEGLIMRDDHVRILLNLYGPEGKRIKGALVVVPEKEWPKRLADKIAETRKLEDEKKYALFPELRPKVK